MYVFIFIVLISLLGHTRTQDANCIFTQDITPGQTYYVYSPNYPNYYTGRRECLWVATAPPGYNCRLDCSLIDLPQSPSCSGDRLLISKSGDPQMASADTYCGKGSVVAVSTGQAISVGLITQASTSGGRFYCELKAQPASGTGTCSCGYKKLNRIVGGVETGVNEFPMMAGLVDVATSNVECGAVIISNNYLLSAAHCVAKRSVTNTIIVVGAHNVKYFDTPATKTYSIAGFKIHEEYSSTNYNNDIAIVKAVGSIAFSSEVGPVCLPFKFVNTDLTGAVLTILGWGTTLFGGPTSDTLQKVNVNVISQNTCSSVQPNLTNRQICTYAPGKDACQYDSGGPLLYTDPSTGLLFDIGIVSFGNLCGTAKPGVNTRVPALLNWIVQNTPDANYCRK